MKKYGKISLVLVAVLATVLISGCIGGDSSSDKFTKEVTVEGLTFYIPEGYELADKSDGGDYVTYSYNEGSSLIGITVYKYSSKNEILSNVKSNSKFSNIDENAQFGGYSGFTADFDPNQSTRKVFIFEKDGKTVGLELSSDLNFDEYVSKILR